METKNTQQATELKREKGGKIFRRLRRARAQHAAPSFSQELQGGPLQSLPTIEREGDPQSMLAHAMGQAIIWKQLEGK